MSTRPVPPAAAPRPSRRRRAGRIALRTAIGALGILLVAGAGAFGASEWKARARVAVPEHRTLVVPTDADAVARGARLARVRFCAECHAQDLGGRVLLDDPKMGRLAPPSLRAGRRGGPLSDLAWERAVRHGVRPDGSPLLIMPSHEFNELTDEDLGAIAAYARSLPAQRDTTPATRLGPMMHVLNGIGVADLYPAGQIDHARPHAERRAAEVTPAFGKYLASTCTGCHNPAFSGGKDPGAPADWKPASNITPAGIGHYTEGDFVRLMRTGVRPDGSQVADQMPWRFTQAMTDVELRALYAYLRTVPAKPFGAR